MRRTRARQGRRTPISRTAKIALELLFSAILTLAVGVGLLAWRLSTGPISLTFLTPLLEQALDAGGDGVTVHVDDTVLEWTAGSGNLPEFRVHGLHVLSAQGDLIAEAPAAAIRLSLTALLAGRLAPARIDLIGPQITLERSADGIRLLHTGATGGAPGAAAGAPGAAAADAAGERGSLLALLLPELDGAAGAGGAAPGGRSGVLRDIAQVGVVGASLTLEDRITGRTWFAPAADILVARTPAGLRAQLAVTLEVAGRTARLEGSAVLAVATRIADLAITMARLDAGMLAMADAALAPVGLLHAEIGGRIEMTVDLARGVQSARVDLATGPGLVVDPALFPEPVGFAGLRIRAQSTDALARIAFDLAIDNAMGASIVAAGRVEDALDAPRVSLNAEVRNVAADDLRLLWPVSAGPGAREWTTANVSEGRVEQATVTLVARMPRDGGEIVLEQVDARMRFVNLAVNYRSPMTPVRGVNGTAHFTQSRAVFDVASGSALGLRVDSGQIVLDRIDEPGSTAAIDVNIRGPLRDALTLIDQQPLGYMRKINRAPAEFAGAASARLQLRFPLVQNLSLDDVRVAVAGTVGTFQMRRVALDQEIRGGTVSYQVDDRALQVTGQVQFGPVLADVELTQNFLSTAPFVMRVRARGRVTPADLATLHLDPRPWVDGGTIAGDVLITLNRNRRDDIVIEATLDDAHMAVAPLDWAKPIGARAAAHIEIAMVNDRATDVRVFRVAAPGFEARGGGTFTPDGRALRTLRADQVVSGRTRGRALMTFEGRSSIVVDAAGPSFDLTSLLRDRTPASDDAPLLNIRAEIDRVFIDETRAVEQVRFTGRRSGSRWLSADLEATPRPDGQPLLRATVRTESTGRRTLNAVSPDFGALVAAIGMSANIRGGRLEVTGSTDENRAAKPLVGRVDVRDFRVVNAPLLARILGVAFLTGIGDALRGEGISFTQLDGRFEHDGRRLTMRDWHAYGSAIGMTATGTLNFDDGVVAIEGVVVPANAINSVISNIPVIGDILAGGRNGGIFAANYSATGPLRDPRVSVNMLSSLAPGFLRNLFRGAPAARPAPPGGEAPGQVQ